MDSPVARISSLAVPESARAGDLLLRLRAKAHLDTPYGRLHALAGLDRPLALQPADELDVRDAGEHLALERGARSHGDRRVPRDVHRGPDVREAAVQEADAGHLSDRNAGDRNFKRMTERYPAHPAATRDACWASRGARSVPCCLCPY